MANPGSGNVNLSLNASVFINAMNAASAATNNFNIFINNLNINLGKVASASKPAASTLDQLGAALKGLQLYAAAQAAMQFTNAMYDAASEAAEFARSISLIQTIAEDTSMTFEKWSEGVRKVSDALALPLLDTAAGTYDLLSNQVAKGADAFGVMTSAGQLANLTNSKVSSSVNTLSNAINAYGFSSSQAEKLAAELFVTVDLGRVRLDELEATSGRVYETGKSLGVTWQEVNAGMAAITQTGVKTNTAMTLLVNVFQKLLKPTNELQELYNQEGVTPDTIVRMNGLAGVIDLIDKKTRGSTAAALKYFNEIRSSQGFQILKDRMGAYKEALEAQKNAQERYQAKKKEFENSDGFKFQQSMNQWKNFLTTGWKTEALTVIVKMTDALKGLSEYAGIAGRIVGQLGVAVTGLAGLALGAQFMAWTSAAGGLAAALSTLAVAFPPVAAAASLGGLLYVWAKQDEEADQIRQGAEKFRQQWIQTGKDIVAANATALAKMDSDTQESLNKRQGAILQYTSQVRVALSKIAASLSESDSAIRDKLKNAIELAVSGAKDSLKVLENSLSNALSNVAKAKQGSQDATSRAGDARYNARLAIDKAETGGANERAIMQGRMAELDRQRAAAAARGDVEALNDLYSKQEAIIASAASATNPDGSMKYYGQIGAINQLLESQLALNKQIEASEFRKAEALRLQKEALAKNIKEVEDAGKALYEFDVVDKNGNKKFATEEEYQKERAKVKKQYDDATNRLRMNPNASDAFKGVNYIQSQRDLSDRLREVDRQWVEAGKSGTARNKNMSDIESVEVLEASAKALVERGMEEMKKISEKIQEKLARQGNVTSDQKGVFAEILLSSRADGKFWNTDEATAKRQEDYVNSTMAKAEKSMQAGKYGEAIQFLESIGRTLKSWGVIDQKGIMASDKYATPKDALLDAKSKVLAREKAEQDTNAAKELLKGVTEKLPQALDALNKGLGPVGKTSLEVNAGLDALAGGLSRLNEGLRNLDISVKSKSAGGFAGYFSGGGISRGIDTMLARVNPNEFIMNPQSSMRFKSQLAAMNMGWGGNPQGQGPTTNVGDIHVNVQGGQSSMQTINEIGAGLRRAIRRGVIQL
jgi:TP901 family phage tail tape measure protein